MSPLLGPETLWPPLPPTITHSLRTWNAWYKGDPGSLGHDSPPRTLTTRRWGLNRNRAFWAPEDESASRPRLHMPIASDIAAASADLLFGQEIDIRWGDQVLADRMREVLDANDFHSQLLESAEVAAAIGGAYLRAGWDTTVADHVLISTLGQDQVVPVFRWGRLAEAIVWQVVWQKDGQVWRHLEYHTPGKIEHRLHHGDAMRLGRPVPLETMPATAGLPDSVATGWPGLAVTYVPNVKPAPMWRGDPLGKDLGRSDFGVDGTIGFMDALDEAWSSWMRDLRLGKARIMVASQMLDAGRKPGTGAMLDIEREVYEGFHFGQPENASLSDMISAQQFGIRHAEHAATVDALLGVVVRSCGYSGSTFGLTSDTVKTASEISSIERRSAQTRERKTRYWTSALKEFLSMLAVVDYTQFRAAVPGKPDVAFAPDSQPSEMEKAQSLQAFRAAQVMSIETGVRIAQPDLDDIGVAAEVARILAETAAPIEMAVPEEDELPEEDEDYEPEPPAA